MNRTTANMKTCMCIELDPDFFYLMQSFAERSGLRAVHVSRGREALSLVRYDRPTVVFLESDGPAEMPAWDVLSALKAEPDTRDIPVVLFSWINEEDRALEQGADVYVQKPVMYVDFLDALAVAGVCQENNDIQASDLKGGAVSPPGE